MSHSYDVLVASLGGIDPLTRIGFGDVVGYERFSLWGHNGSVDTGAVPEVIHNEGLSFPPFMSAATSLEAISDNAADTVAGTGARTLHIDGLDASYNRLTQTITLNGNVGAVAIPTQLAAVNMLRVGGYGSALTNVGTLTVRDAGGGTTRMTVPPGVGISQSSARTIPAGYTCQLRTHLFSINRTTSARNATVTGAFQLWDGSAYGPVVYPLDIAVSDTQPIFFQAEPGLILPERSRYWHVCRAVSGNGTDLTSASWGILRLNTAA